MTKLSLHLDFFLLSFCTKENTHLTPFSVLQILATLPSYQRRGIGAQLLAPGLAAADEANAKTYIEATAIGLPLYLRHGWKPVGELRIDLDSFGYEGMGVRVQKLLIREPRGGREDGETEGEK